MPSEAREHDLSVLGLRLPALEAGPGDAEEAVVFLHGNPGSRHDWDRLVPEVGAFARALAFDLPGLGQADKPRDWDYGLGAYATVVAAALNVAGVKRAHLVMHDLGGGAGLLWAAAHPDAFASAVIMGTGVLMDYRWHRLAALQRRPVVGPLMVRLTTEQGFRRTLKAYNSHPRGLPDAHIDRMWKDYDIRSRRAMMTMYRASPPSGFERLAPVFRELDRPALVLWGEHDPFVPVDQAHRQRESFPRAEVVVLAGSGHWAFLDNPDEASAHITGFLRSQVGA